MGHGHVIPNEDGSAARCGGPAICTVCAQEAAACMESSSTGPAYSVSKPDPGKPCLHCKLLATDLDKALTMWGRSVLKEQDLKDKLEFANNQIQQSALVIEDLYHQLDLSKRSLSIDRLVDKFLSWPLPKSVCSDDCVTDRRYPHERSGTQLLTADEARQMFEYILA